MVMAIACLWPKLCTICYNPTDPYVELSVRERQKVRTQVRLMGGKGAVPVLHVRCCSTRMELHICLATSPAS